MSLLAKTSVVGVLVSSLQIGAQTAATLTVSDARGFPGRTATVPVSLRHDGSVAALQFDLAFSENEFIGNGFRTLPQTNGLVIRTRQIGPGSQRVLAYSKGQAVLRTNLQLGSLAVISANGNYAGEGKVAATNSIFSKSDSTSLLSFRLVPGSISVSPIFQTELNHVEVYLAAQAGTAFVIQASTDLRAWVNIATNTPLQNYVIATDVAASGIPSRFYRILPALSFPAGGMATAATTLAGTIDVNYPASPGRVYVLQTSTNLLFWSDLKTNIASGDAVGFTNLAEPQLPQRYFKVQEIP